MLETPHQQPVWWLGQALSYDHPRHHQISSNSEITKFNVTKIFQHISNLIAAITQTWGVLFHHTKTNPLN